MSRGRGAEETATGFQRMQEDWSPPAASPPAQRGERRRREELFRDEYHHHGSSSSSRLSSNDPQKTEEGNRQEGHEEIEDEEVYIVRQEYGYLSIFFSPVQGIILALMMWQCGIAPMEINPMIGPYPDALSGTQIETLRC